MKEFYINFNTKEMPGKILATKVTLSQELIRDMDKPLSINLCEHPLYKQLEQYVKANPSRR